MKLRRMLWLLVTLAVLGVTLPGSFLAYHASQQAVIEREGALMVQESGRLLDAHLQRFRDSPRKLAAVARLLEAALAAPARAHELVHFERLARMDADGIWRSRREVFDGTREAGMFLPGDATVAQKVRSLRVKQVFDVFGAAALRHFENVWLLTPDRGEVIHDAAYPDFVFLMGADTDYTVTPWYTLGSPESNPQREHRFTAPLYDPPSRTWMVSGVMPLEVDGAWVGTLGEDLQLSEVIQGIFTCGPRCGRSCTPPTCNCPK